MSARNTHWLGITLVIAASVFALTDRVLTAHVMLALGVLLIGCATIAAAIERRRP